MSKQRNKKPQEIANRAEIIEVIRNLATLSELVEKQNGHYKHELDLEVIVYGRTYTGGKVGPYARLLVYESGAEIVHENDWAGNCFYILVDGQLDIMEKGGQRKERSLVREEVFGEMALIEGDRRTATVRVPAGEFAKVLELQRPALRLLRKLPAFAQIFDEHYRRHGLIVSTTTIRDASNKAFTPALLAQLKEISEFRAYGKPHALLRSGEPITHIYFINKGWVEVERNVADGSSAVETVGGEVDQTGMRFLGAGNCFGLEAITERARLWQYTVKIQARTEVLQVPVASLTRRPELLEVLQDKFSGFSEVDEDQLLAPVDDLRSLLATQKEIATGIVDATNLLVMDMDLCVRCGNCSLACHKVHGQSRLLRRGISIERPVKPQGMIIQHVLAPSVCLHCQDPECLTGCPTGAISRFEGGQIDIEPKTCIGCGDCATQCPYNAISMIPKKKGAPPTLLSWMRDGLKLTAREMPPPVTDDKNLLAVKCNLCEGTPLNPADREPKAYSCEENCPTGALVRVNPLEYFSETKNVIGTIYRDKTHAIGRDIHKADPVATRWRRGGMLAVLISTLVVVWAAGRYGLDLPRGESGLSVRWLTGFAGLLGILGEMAYVVRKQIYKRRFGPLRYWMLAHVYLGIITCIVLLVHGGWRSGGLLTSMLMIAFDLTLISGAVGILSYYIAPRLLTRIEGEPLLLEDLLQRRRELREELEQIKADDEQLKEIILRQIPRRLLSLAYLFSQYVRHVKLDQLLAEACRQFEGEADRLKLSEPSRLIMLKAVKTAATLRRVESLIYLHQLLRLWIPPHVVSTAIMLALMIAHIFQVVYFAGR